MICSRLWRIAHDDLHAGVRRVVLASTFFAKHVSEAVTVALHELVVGHDLGEVALHELDGSVQIQALGK